MVRNVVTLLVGLALQLTAGGLARVFPELGETLASASTPAAQTRPVAARPASTNFDWAATVGGLPEQAPALLSGFWFGPETALMQAAAADVLGLSTEELMDELATGRTLAEIAAARGVEPQAVAEAMEAAALEAKETALERAVEAGDLTAEQADKWRAVFEAQDFSLLLDLPYLWHSRAPGQLPYMPFIYENLDPEGGLPWPDGGPLPQGPGEFSVQFGFRTGDGEMFTFEFGSGSEAFQAAAAQALGLSAEQLRARQEQGETLAEIAEAQGVDLGTVEAAVQEAMQAEARAKLEAAVAEGRLTREQADDILEHIENGMRLSVSPLPRDPALLEDWRPGEHFGLRRGLLDETRLFPWVLEESTTGDMD